jgi:hypothetical protein
MLVQPIRQSEPQRAWIGNSGTMAPSYNAAAWRQLAQRARELANRLHNPALSAPIIRMAAGFDALAERVDHLQAKRAASPDRRAQADEGRTPRCDRAK